MPTHRAKIAEGGRLIIPAELRRRLGLHPGSTVILDVSDDELRVRSLNRAVERAQAIVRSYVPEGVSLSEELIRERREQAAKEAERE
jgi:AbrB family looped-hinge helix DNA binding protein